MKLGVFYKIIDKIIKDGILYKIIDKVIKDGIFYKITDKIIKDGINVQVKFPCHFEDVPLVEFMYLACQVRVTVGESGLCCCTCVIYFEL